MRATAAESYGVRQREPAALPQPLGTGDGHARRAADAEQQRRQLAAQGVPEVPAFRRLDAGGGDNVGGGAEQETGHVQLFRVQ